MNAVSKSVDPFCMTSVEACLFLIFALDIFPAGAILIPFKPERVD